MTDTTNAAIDLDRKKSNIVKVFASTGIERKDTIYKAGAYRNFDTTNKFNLYRQLLAYKSSCVHSASETCSYACKGY